MTAIEQLIVAAHTVMNRNQCVCWRDMEFSGEACDHCLLRDALAAVDVERLGRTA